MRHISKTALGLAFGAAFAAPALAGGYAEPVVEAPVAAPPPVVVNNGAPVKTVPAKTAPVNGASSFWLVTFSTGRELVVAASSVLVAAQLGAAQGEVRAVGPLPSL